jgi:adenylate cyclase
VRPPAHLAEKIRAGRGALEGERKQVTVLFADVIGSMELAERHDPEEWRALMDRFFSVLSAGVHRFEGTVDKFTGDGIMALFGAPVAHEDHARRAGYAALALQADLADLPFAVRMGLNSGEVVVGAIGEDLAMEYTAIGRTVGLAQRMEQLAAPDSVYLSEHTAALVEGYLELADLGEFEVKGVTRPLRVYELAGVGPAHGRLDVSRARGFSRFVGRDAELRALEDAQARGGRVVGIVGEPGVGKSRLTHEFVDRMRARGVPVRHVAGQAHATAVPLLPVLELLRAVFEIGDQDAPGAARERIATRLAALGGGYEDDLPLLFDFLAVPDPERPAPRMDPDARQRRLLDVIARVTRAEGTRRPGVIVVEDLHWLDPASEAFLAHLIAAAADTRSLVVLNFRPEYEAAWMASAHYEPLALAPLADDATDALLEHLLGGDPSLAELADLIRARTEGNPFFVEELVQALVEAGSLTGERGAHRLAAPVSEAAVPASVQATLAARIDRLAPRDKAVLQAAAVIGREFPVPVLERVAGFEPAALEDALAALTRAAFLHEQELYPERLYAFKHPLTQEVAYRSQLAQHRGPVHAAVARAMAEQDAERLDERAALVAQHWEAAGETLEAARWHARAGAWAGTASPAEALRHWDRVRALTDTLPESPETVALGLTARIFGLQFGWRLGITSEEAQRLFADGERLAAQSGDLHSRAILLNVYGAVRCLGDGDVQEFARLQRLTVALAEESGDPNLYMATAPGSYAFLGTGEFREGLAVIDRALELADGDPTVGTGVNYLCPFAWCYGFKGALLALVGELDEGRRLVRRGAELAREYEDVEILGFTHLYDAYIAFLAGEPDAMVASGRRALESADRIGDAFSRAYALLLLGFGLRLQGEWGAAIDALERSQALTAATRTAVDLEALRLALLGECRLALGEADRGRALTAEAVALAAGKSQVTNEVYAHMARAHVLLAGGAPEDRAEAAAGLERALTLSRAAEAKGHEPHVHVALAALAECSGDEAARASALREAHRQFTAIGASAAAEALALTLDRPAV